MLDAYIAYQARIQPHAAALITADRWVTYAELEANVDRFAAGLRALGVAPARGVVAIRVGDPYLQHVIFAALARLGVISSPADDPGADLYLCDGQASADRPHLMLTPAWIAATLAADPDPVTPVLGSPESIVRVMLSSGTTRIPRRVARTWQAIQDNGRTAALTYLARKGGRWVAVTGMDTGLGQAMAMAAWACGASLVTGVGVDWLAGELSVLQPTIVGLTPIQLRSLLAKLPRDCAVMPDLRVVVTGSVLPREVAIDARRRLASDLCASYGATECGNTALATGLMLETWAGAAGYPAPGVRIDIIGEHGDRLPPGQQGEVRITSDRMSHAYIGDPDATAAAFRDGGFYPGDMGWLTPDGMLVIDGRKDDRMNLGGGKFLPNLMEEVALACPGVIDAAAFAVPDEMGIEQCWLGVVQGEGFDRTVLAEMIRAKGETLPPARFAWTAEIPRNAMGKIDRARLRRETMAALGQGS